MLVHGCGLPSCAGRGQLSSPAPGWTPDGIGPRHRQRVGPGFVCQPRRHLDYRMPWLGNQHGPGRCDLCRVRGGLDATGSTPDWQLLPDHAVHHGTISCVVRCPRVETAVRPRRAGRSPATVIGILRTMRETKNLNKGQMLGARLPLELVRDLELIEVIEQTDRSRIARRLLAKAVREWKLEYCAQQYGDGTLTLARATRDAGMSLWDMMEYSRARKGGCPRRSRRSSERSGNQLRKHHTRAAVIMQKALPPRASTGTEFDDHRTNEGSLARSHGACV